LGGHGQDEGAGICPQPAASRIETDSARRLRTVWVVILEMLAALALLVLIVWWTWPKKRKDGERRD
jgi:cyanate permease